MTRTPWWKHVRSGTPEQVILLHMDLAGHSKWAADEENDPKIARERGDLVARLRLQLGRRDYDQVFWAGDGGLFARQFRTDDTLSSLCLAADDVFVEFRKWNPGGLHIRVVATVVNVLVDPEPGDWYSPKLNEFLKYEREIGLNDTFVITREAYRYLDPTADCYTRFSRSDRSREVVLPTGNKITIFLDTKNAGQGPTSKRALPTGSEIRTFPSTKNTGQAPTSQVIIGDRTIMLTPRQLEVVDLMRKGLSYREIATDLGIIPSSARDLISKICQKAGVGSREEFLAKLSGNNNDKQ